MKVINWKSYNKGKLRGFFDVLTGEGFTIKGFKIMEGINGEFVSRPSQQDKNGEWFDTVYCTKEMSAELLKIVKRLKGLGDTKEDSNINQDIEQDLQKSDDENIPF